MKMLAETSGEFMLLDIGEGQAIQSHRPSVVVLSGFIQSRIALGQITKVADVPQEATDAEFEAYWNDAGDRDLAISSYLSKFEEAPKPKAPAKKGK